MSLREKAIQDIITSVETLAEYVVNSNFEDKAQYKALKIYQSWEELSPYYLWSIPWFHNVLEELKVSNMVQKCKDEFDKIGRSGSIQKVIKECVQKAEEYFNLPPNIDL
ncbi:hypothetical protein D3C78_1717380 [compost metagenome]